MSGLLGIRHSVLRNAKIKSGVVWKEQDFTTTFVYEKLSEEALRPQIFP